MNTNAIAIFNIVKNTVKNGTAYPIESIIGQCERYQNGEEMADFIFESLKNEGIEEIELTYHVGYVGTEYVEFNGELVDENQVKRTRGSYDEPAMMMRAA
jgi:ABC-type sugar transport system substrate-binding protein